LPETTEAGSQAQVKEETEYALGSAKLLEDGGIVKLELLGVNTTFELLLGVVTWLEEDVPGSTYGTEEELDSSSPPTPPSEEELGSSGSRAEETFTSKFSQFGFSLFSAHSFIKPAGPVRLPFTAFMSLIIFGSSEMLVISPLPQAAKITKTAAIAKKAK
jgi:hypothetical protein